MAEAEDRDITVTRILQAPPDLVFDTWTNVDHISNWWGPHGFTTTTHKADIRPGGEWVFTMHGPDGVDYPNHIWFEIIERPSLITYRHAGEEDTRTEDVKFTTRVTFEPESNGTRVTLSLLFPTKDDRDRVERDFGAVEGGHNTLARLDREVSRQAVVRTINAWAGAFCARDLDALISLYADDAMIFDAIPPLRERPGDSFRTKLEHCLPYFPETFSWETAEDRLEVSDDIAFAHRLFKYTCEDPNHPATQTWLRHTVGLKRINGGWKIIHDHVSLPFDPETSTILFQKTLEA